MVIMDLISAADLSFYPHLRRHKLRHDHFPASSYAGKSVIYSVRSVSPWSCWDCMQYYRIVECNSNQFDSVCRCIEHTVHTLLHNMSMGTNKLHWSECSSETVSKLQDVWWVEYWYTRYVSLHMTTWHPGLVVMRSYTYTVRQYSTH